MALILNIDTSTQVGSVVFSKDGEVIIERVSLEDRTHAVKTGVFVDEVLSDAERMGLRPDAIAVSSGPGSYTGLRIGVSLAKGLCYGYNIPLISADTLTIMTSGVLANHTLPKDALLCPMIDARRMEVYYTLFNSGMEKLKPISAGVIDAESLREMDERTLFVFGDGSAKCKPFLNRPNIHFIDHVHPMAKDLAPLADALFRSGTFVNVAYFEPFYLKNFVATISKKNVLG